MKKKKLDQIISILCLKVVQLEKRVQELENKEWERENADEYLEELFRKP
jgi:hypothetical protein